MFEKGKTYTFHTYLYGIKVNGKARILSQEYKPKVGRIIDLKILTEKLRLALLNCEEKRVFFSSRDGEVFCGEVLFFEPSKGEASTGRWRLFPEKRLYLRVSVPYIYQKASVLIIDPFEEREEKVRVVDVSEMGMGITVSSGLKVNVGNGIVVNWLGASFSGKVIGVKSSENLKRLSVKFDHLPPDSAKFLREFILNRQKELAKMLSG